MLIMLMIGTVVVVCLLIAVDNWLDNKINKEQNKS
jgi:hypothetical protein